MTFQIHIASDADRGRIQEAYDRWDYRNGLGADDTIWMAETAGEIVGLVRIAREHETLVLRGMRIAESCRRQGLGTKMLDELANWLRDRECYCIPYGHLTGFYGHIGFMQIAADGAPHFLAERLAEYKKRPGMSFTLMRR